MQRRKRKLSVASSTLPSSAWTELSRLPGGGTPVITEGDESLFCAADAAVLRIECALLCFGLVNRPQQIGYRKDKAQATPGPGTYEPKIDIETFKGAPTSR